MSRHIPCYLRRKTKEPFCKDNPYCVWDKRCKTLKPRSKVSRKRKSKVSRKRKSKKSRKRKSKTVPVSLNKYDEDWAIRFITHIGPSGGGGVNNYTGSKNKPSRRILDARKKLIDKIYQIHSDLKKLGSHHIRDMLTGQVLEPKNWRDPPQYMHRNILKQQLSLLKKSLIEEKKLAKSRKIVKRKSRKPRVKKSRKIVNKKSRKIVNKKSRKPRVKKSRKSKPVTQSPFSGLRKMRNSKDLSEEIYRKFMDNHNNALLDDELDYRSKGKGVVKWIPTVFLPSRSKLHDMLSTEGFLFDKNEVTNKILGGFGFFDYLDKKYGYNPNLVIPYDIKFENITLDPNFDPSKCKGTYVDLDTFVPFSDPEAPKDAFLTSIGQCFSKKWIFDYWNKTNLSADDNSAEKVSPTLPKDPFTNQLFSPTVLIELISQRRTKKLDPLQTLVGVVGNKKKGIFVLGPYLDLCKLNILKEEAIRYFNKIPNTEKTLGLVSAIDYLIQIGDVSNDNRARKLLSSEGINLKAKQREIIDQAEKISGKNSIISLIIKNFKLTIRDNILAYFMDRMYSQYIPGGKGYKLGWKKFADVEAATLDSSISIACFITAYLIAKKSKRCPIIKIGKMGNSQVVYENLHHGFVNKFYNKNGETNTMLKIMSYDQFNNLSNITSKTSTHEPIIYTASFIDAFNGNLGLVRAELNKLVKLVNSSWITKTEMMGDIFTGYNWILRKNKTQKCGSVVSQSINTNNPCRSCIRKVATGEAYVDKTSYSSTIPGKLRDMDVFRPKVIITDVPKFG